MRILGLALGCMAIFVPVPSAAQALSWGVSTAPDHTDGCELHIFPAQPPKVTDATQSHLTGLVPNLMDHWFAVKNPAAVQQFMASVASVSFQVEFLRGIDYSNTIKGVGRSVIVHDAPIPDFIRTGTKEFLMDLKTRARGESSSSARCYEELVLTVPNYTKSTMSSSVKNGFVYRRFDAGFATYAEFGAYGRAVPNFPPKKDDQLALAADGLQAVYRENIMRMLNENVLKKVNEKSWGKIN